MEKNKKRILFALVNVLLVGIIGLVLGLCLPVASNKGMLISFILLLVTLLCPTLLFFFVKDALSPIGITSVVFIVGNIITMIVFMCIKPAGKTVAITEAAIAGAYLVIGLICIACLPKKNA